MVEPRSSDAAFDRHLRSLLPPDGTGVVNCTAPAWCAPCRRLHPTIEELRGQHARIKFLVLDMDDAEAAAQGEPFGVTGLPTTLVAHEGTVLERIVGADAAALRRAVAKLDENISKGASQIALPYAAQASLGTPKE